MQHQLIAMVRHLIRVAHILILSMVNMLPATERLQSILKTGIAIDYC